MIQQSTNARSGKQGFTLVEVLVVISIIVVLAVVVFSVSVRVRNSARSAATLSNLREIGGAATLWMGENNNFYPPCWDNTKGRNRSYVQTLGAYLHDDPNFRGPESKFIAPNARLTVTVGRYSHPATYSMNPAVCRNITAGSDGTVPKLIHATQVERPSEVILMADGCQNPSNRGQSNVSAYRIIGAVGQTGPPSQFREPIPVGPDEDLPSGDGWFRYPYGRCHALMCDGSAQTFNKGSIQKRNVWIDIVR